MQKISSTSLAPWMRHAFLFAMFCAFMAGSSSSAQPNLNFKRIVNNWPTIELYFSAACQGQPVYFTDRRFFSIRENGVEVPDFELWCPDPHMRCGVSLALVLDASASMTGAPNTAAKSGGSAMIDILDGVLDEAAVIWGSAVPFSAQSMTTYKPLLHTAVQTLPASGTSSIWDAINFGLQTLINDGINPCRALIVYTDGYDNSSAQLYQQCIALANRNRIRIFTVGLGTRIDHVRLQNIADLTGGRYYENPSAAQYVAIYQEISTIIFQGFQECLLTYQAQCMDGTTRTVDVTLKDTCGGSDTKTKFYKAPLDATTMQLQLESLPARIGKGALLKLSLPFVDRDTDVDSVVITAEYDRAQASFTGLAFPAGSPFAGAVYESEDIPQGLRLLLRGPARLNRYSRNLPILNLDFTPRGPVGDTLRVPLTLRLKYFGYCLPSDSVKSAIVYYPEGPQLEANLSVPDSLRWKQTLRRYEPDTFDVRLRVANTGEAAAMSVAQWIEYPKKNLQLLSDSVFEEARPLLPGDSLIRIWTFRALPVPGFDSFEICAAAEFTNAGTERRCARTLITRLGPGMEIGSIASSDGVTAVNLRAWCSGDTLRQLQKDQVTLTVRGRPVAVDSVHDAIPSEATPILRVFYTEPCPNGNSSSVTVALSALCDSSLSASKAYQTRETSFLVRILGPAHLCEGDSTTLDAGPDQTYYRWSTGDTTRSITVHRGGYYDVLVRNSDGCERRGFAAVSGNFKPQIWPRGTVLLCSGFSATLQTNAEDATFEWSNGERSPNIHVNTPGSYAVKVTDSFGCVSITDSVHIVLVPMLQPTLRALGPVEFCAGGAVTLEADSGYTAYRWSNGGSVSNRLMVTESGTYHVTVFDASDTCNAVSNEITVTEHPRPATPTITRDGDVLRVRAEYRHEWYLNGTLIPGAVDSAYAAVKTGNYRVRSYTSFGCYTESSSFLVGTLGINVAIRPAELSLLIYPDPAVSRVTVTRVEQSGRPLRLTVIDALGRRCLETFIHEGANSADLDLRDLAPGLYTVHAEDGISFAIRHFIVQ